MDKIVVKGGRKLNGNVKIEGAKMPCFRCWQPA